MAYNNGATVYQRNKVLTASPAELNLMLYDGLIKFCNIAIAAIESKDVSKTHLNIVKAQNIVLEFRSTLDSKYPITKDFDRIYDYLYRRLVEANIKKDKEILEEVLEHTRVMRDTWKEVMELNKTVK